jgi:hypothetical protein
MPHKSMLLLVLFGTLAACRSPAPAAPVPTALPAVAPIAAVEAAQAPTATEPVANPLGDKAARRARPAAIIGGCAEACETPEAAVVYFLSQLQHQDRVTALHGLFEWSLLEVDGKKLGEHWADQWAYPAQHEVRRAEIDLWLKEWSAWFDRIEEPDGLAHTRASGIRLERPAGDTERVIVHFRHPGLKDDTTEATWRIDWCLRGYEWLVCRVDHKPGDALAK